MTHGPKHAQRPLVCQLAFPRRRRGFLGFLERDRDRRGRPRRYGRASRCAKERRVRDGQRRRRTCERVQQVWVGDRLLAWSRARICAALPGRTPTFQCCCCWYCCLPCGFGFGLGFLTQRTHSTRMCGPPSCGSTQPTRSSLGSTPPHVRRFVASRILSRLTRTCRRLLGRPQPRSGERMSPPPSASSWALRGEVVSMRRGGGESARFCRWV
jgi:hypothetical protein